MKPMRPSKFVAAVQRLIGTANGRNNWHKYFDGESCIAKRALSPMSHIGRSAGFALIRPGTQQILPTSAAPAHQLRLVQPQMRSVRSVLSRLRSRRCRSTAHDAGAAMHRTLAS